MAMSVGSPSGEGEVLVDINTTPLIDVMLVLLIMLIITIPVQTHSVKMDMPINPPPPPDKPPPVIDLGIDFDGTITWNDTPVTGRDQLESFIFQARDADPQPEVHVKPNRLAKYGVVAEVMAESQRLGLTKIGFVGMEQYMD
ncbi:MAG TPA: biopolymer transporter ExbD [Stellaceae bacterium]|nr:biopolymer transporter ExbD [Stellaceae bacterium]